MKWCCYGPHNVEYSAVAAFPLSGEGISQRSKSEDEEDEYDDAEACRDALLSILGRIKRLNENQRTGLQELERQIGALTKEPFVMGGSFVSRAERLIDEGEKSLRSLA